MVVGLGIGTNDSNCSNSNDVTHARSTEVEEERVFLRNQQGSTDLVLNFSDPTNLDWWPQIQLYGELSKFPPTLLLTDRKREDYILSLTERGSEYTTIDMVYDINTGYLLTERMGYLSSFIQN